MAVSKKAPASKKAPLKRSAPRKAASKPKAKPAARAKPSVKTKPGVKAKPAPAKPAAKGKLVVKTKPVAKAPVKAKAAPKPVEARKSSPARDALKERAMKKAIEQVIAPIESEQAVVDAYMRDLDHPFKAELEAVRAIILGVSDKISERIKWNAPSFFYKEDLAAFNPRASEFAHLILLFPGGAGIPAKSTLLEGKAKDRREAKFHSLEDVQTKKKALQKLVKDWVALRDAESRGYTER
ncbi:MAG: DUF1801 domain-containing protein [Polyangiaceae bacterium]